MESILNTIVFGGLRIAFKIGIKIVKFTGLYYFIGMIFICGFVYDKEKGNLSHSMNLFLFSLVIFSLILSALTTIQNIIRIIKPDFSYTRLISRCRGVRRKQVGETYENIEKEFVGLESGVVFGKLKGKYLVMPQNTDGHIMVVGGQGSGKSSCVAIPTLLNYDRSVFAIDIKGELSEHRKKYNYDTVKVFDPMSEHSPHYNPYAILNEGNKIQGAREMANCIIPITKEDKDPYWKQSAQNLLIACILHFENEKKDFPSTCRAIMEKNINELLEVLQESPVSEVKLFVNQFIGIDTKQLASIYSTLANEIMLFATDKDVMRALSESNNIISPKDLETLTSIFIKIDEDKLEQWKTLLNLMVSQFLKSFEKRQDRTDKKILFMIDEFARIGKIESITNGLATLRSKGIQIMLIIQSLAQLDAIYGQDTRKIITDNCNYKIILNANDVDTQEYFSKLVGTVDIEKKSLSVNSRSFETDKNRGVNISEEEKRIIKPESFAYLEKPVVFTPKGYFQPDKVKWYEDKKFLERENRSEGVSA